MRVYSMFSAFLFLHRIRHRRALASLFYPHPVPPWTLPHLSALYITGHVVLDCWEHRKSIVGVSAGFCLHLFTIGRGASHRTTRERSWLDLYIDAFRPKSAVLAATRYSSLWDYCSSLIYWLMRKCWRSQRLDLWVFE